MFHYVTRFADPPVVLKPGFKVRFELRPAAPEGTLVRGADGFDTVAKPLKLARGVRFSSTRDMTLDYYDHLALAADPETGLWTLRRARKAAAGGLSPRQLADAVAKRTKSEKRPARPQGRGGRLASAARAVGLPV